MYICVEGVIGVGKTTLTNLISEDLNINPVYEKYEENPFLNKSYIKQFSTDEIRLQSQMFFVTSRYFQMKKLEEDHFKTNQNIISDYHIYKTLIFGKITLTNDDYKTFESIFNLLLGNHKEEDLLIILTASVDEIKNRIKKRNRSYEEQIDEKFLINLIDEYEKFIEQLKSSNRRNYLVIDTTKLNLIESQEDQKKVLNLIRNKVESR